MTRRWGVVAGCLCSGMAVAASAPLADDAPNPAPTQAGVKQEDPGAAADRLLARSATPVEAALAWLAEHPGASDEPAEARLAKAIEESAAAAATLQPGVRFYERTQWTTDGEDTSATALPPRLVLLVGGLDDARTIFDTAAPTLGSTIAKEPSQVRVARIDLPADRSLRTCADLLAQALRSFGQRGVQRVDLVGHFAGGLLVRDVVTRPEFYNGFATPAEGSKGQGLPKIGRIVLVGTPGRGTWLAPVLVAREARTRLARWIESDGRDSAAFGAFFHGGATEWVKDVLPGSAYLTELNTRPSPRWTRGANAAPGPGEVPVTVVIGTLAGGSALEGVDLKPMFGWPLVRQSLGGGDVEKALAALEELGRVVSDGLTPVTSAELEGADDVVYAEANHRSLLRPWVQGETEQPPAVKVIVERLK